MILFFDILPFQKLLPYNQTITCMACGHFGRYEVYLTGNRFRLFFIPLFTFGKYYLVKTTCCDTVYKLDPEIGKALEKGQSIHIHEENLTLYQEGSVPNTSQCPNCGQTHEVGANYCSHCGYKFK